MTYSKEQIDSYLNILEKYKKQPERRGVSGGCNPPVCLNCREDKFSIYLGQHICDSCGVFNGYVLGYFDIKERERLFYKKKSVYNRKYHYEKKVDQISKRVKLTDDEKCRLYNELMKINDDIMKIQNKKFGRKRMINIFYLIKKILQKMGNEKHKLVYLKISPQTLKNYEIWWENYKSI